ncbi:MAG: helix-turn-helix transcriptional regulator [Gammaproteobacteria bacterium]|nr:helix-turn-helix transcriptional regulator [Gammaproteobacteria bacterium]
MKNYKEAQKRTDISIGESVKIIRELQELSQNELSAITGIPQSTLSAIEHNKINLGVERAKVLARALKCHPAVLVFPSWDVNHEIAA